MNVDRTKVKSLNVPLGAVFATLQNYLGSTYVNDFNEFGRTFQVRLQAEVLIAKDGRVWLAPARLNE